MDYAYQVFRYLYDFVGQRENTTQDGTDVDIIYDRNGGSDPAASRQAGWSGVGGGSDPRTPAPPPFQLNPESSPFEEQGRVILDYLDSTSENDEMEQLINRAISSVQDMSFDNIRSASFTSVASELLTSADTAEVRRFMGLVSARLHKAFILEKSDHVVHGIRFFYSALLLSREDVVWFGKEQDEAVLILVDVQKIEQFLWKKVFSKTQFTPYKYQEILQLIEELKAKVLTVSKQTLCPGVCYHMANTLFTAYHRMRMRERLFKDNVKHVLLTLVRCAVSKDRHDLVEDMAKLVAERYFDMENSEACELWSRCSLQRGDVRQAVKLAELAVGCAHRTDKSRLEEFLFSLRIDLTRQERRASEVDLDWIKGTGVNHNIESWKPQNKNTYSWDDQKKKKHKGKRKAVPKTRESAKPVFYERNPRRRRHTLTGTRSVSGTPALPDIGPVDPAYRPVAVRRHREEAMIEVDLWAESQSESESSEDDYEFETDEPGEEEEEEDQRSEEGPEPPSKSWFEESQDLYNSGQEGEQLIVGEGLDINYHPSDNFILNPPRYERLKPHHELDHLRKTEPEKYKLCRIELDGPHRATCRVMETGQSTHVIEIHGRRKCGQTFNNDDVLVEILQNDSTREEDSEKVFGKVVGVYHSPFKEEEYRLLACTSNPREGHVMHPMCKSVPKMYIWKGFTKQHHKNHQYRIDVYKIDGKRKLRFDEYFDILPNKRGQYVFLVAYLTWHPQFTYPRGAVLKVLDCGSTFSSGLTVLLHQFNVPTYYKKETVVHTEHILAKPEEKPEEEIRKGYTDLRDVEVFTIDPPQSKDLDDALSIWKKGDNFVVGVHIADVAAVVKKDDAIDKEALKRATSFYTSSEWRTHNMLPEPLSQDRLSLLPGIQRYVLSIFFVVNETGQNVEDPTVKKCLIKSCRKFSYQEAQDIIDGKIEDNVSLKNKIRQLHALAEHLRIKRLKNSRFYVEYVDPRLSDSEDKTEAEEAHALIEEFMIKANQFIASWLMDKDRSLVPLRCQSSPVEEELNQWIQNEEKVMDMMVRLQNKTIQEREIDATQHAELNLNKRTKYLPVQKNTWQQILNACQRGDMSSAQKLLCCDNLHPMQCLAGSHWLTILNSAEYKCSGEGTDSDLSHFMLDIHPYTHFTSPIRRYIDLVIHRLVHAALDEKRFPYSLAEIQEICRHVTKASKNQRRFGRCCRAVKQAEKLAGKPLMFDAVVDTISDSGVSVCIPSLKGMSKRSGEVAFNLLDFSSKPVEKNSPNKREVIGYWNKRVYTFEPLKTRQNRDKQTRENVDNRSVRLSSDMQIVHVQVRDFCKLLKAVFEKSDLHSFVRNLSPKGEDCYLSDTEGQRKVTSDGCGDNNIKHHCRFSLSFSPGQIIRVQMHAQADQGVLSPYVQLFQVCDDLHLCLGHIHDPVNTFARYVTQGIRDSRFGTAKQYRNAWRPIVDMETAVSSVSNEETIIVKDVKVTLRKERNLVLGFFSFDVAFCDARRIMIDGKNIDRLSTMSDKETPFDKRSRDRSLDYLCIRYTPDKFSPNDSILRSSSVWIGHAVITKVRLKEKDDGPIVVTFQLTPNSQEPPPSLVNASFTTMVEIILKTEVDRKSETMLAKLRDSSELEDSEEEDLATYIALSKPVPSLGEHRLQLSRASDDDVPLQEQLEVVSGYMPANNTSQKEAIRKALTSRFSLIQGPPGTGKTYTGIKLVYLFTKINKRMQEKGFDIEQKQVLFCGPSNKSVDLVAKYLMQRLGTRLAIVRMYGKAIENKDFPVPKRDIVSNRSLRGLASDSDLTSITLHRLIRQKGKPHASKITALDEKFAKFFRKMYEVNITQDDIRAYFRLVNRAQIEELKIADVILCTCTVGGNSKLIRLSEIKKKSKIAQCIIDESAMCPEPQSMIPIIANKPDQVVLIGDHKQLRPIVQCTQAADLGLDQSLFERYKEGRAFLNTQYRMHPSICRFPSEEFYEGNLQTGPTRIQDAKWYIKPGEELGIWSVSHVPALARRFQTSTNPKVFCHVTGVEETLTVNTEDGNEQSKSNMLEVEKVVEVFLYLVKQCEVPSERINLMTQYNAQRSAIKQKLKDYGYFDGITTQTVVASQGGEWDYVVFSAVRSLPEYKIETNPTPGWLKHNLGFITDQNQINVALTRARKGLILVGNAHLLRCDPVWQKLISTYKEEGCYRYANQFPPPLPNFGANRRPAVRQRGLLQGQRRT